MKKDRRNILCIDLKSFYASAECVLRGLDPYKAKLAVAGSIKRDSSVILAASIGLKKMGVKSRCRLRDIPKNSDIHIVESRMKTYLEFSNQINKIYLKYVAPEDMHIYSIDETFLDITQSMHLFAKTEIEAAELILKDIYMATGIPASCGIGENMILAKFALDIEAKKNENQIAKWSYEDVPNKLWPVKPLSKMWGIGSKMEAKLNQMGIYEVGDIVKTPRNKIINKFGLVGEELLAHVHGFDIQIIGNKTNEKNRSYGMGQTLYEDYFENTKVLLLEMAEKQAKRIRSENLCCSTIHLSVSYSLANGGGGFSKQMKINPTNSTGEIYESLAHIFDLGYEKNSPIRRVRIALGGIVKNDKIQYSLFEDVKKDNTLNKTVDNIKDRFGEKSVLRAISYTKDGNARYRSTLIGGHSAECGTEEEQ